MIIGKMWHMPYEGMERRVRPMRVDDEEPHQKIAPSVPGDRINKN
jgi:hypothetical protein